jgi:FkbM family methyltransferase
MGTIRFGNWTKIGFRKILKLAGLADTYRFTVESVLKKNFPPNTLFTFVQVGANDGVSNDFLFEFLKARKATGVAIEPVPEYYEKLKRSYGFSQTISLVQLAVHAKEKEVVLFKVKEDSLKNLPAWASGIASLDPLHHKRSNVAIEAMERIRVKADLLMNILSPFQLPKNIDLLQIDVEGYDLEVLRQVDFNQLHPKIIRMEYSNLTEDQTQEAIRMMKNRGYYCFYEDIDLIGVQPKSISL